MHNNITHLQNRQGEKLEKHKHTKQELLTHIQRVLEEPQINRLPAIEKINKNIPKIITEEHNQILLKPISLQKVEITMRHLKVGKAPGPDGFASHFFH